MSPGPEAFSAATLEIAWVCIGRERTEAELSLAPISRAAGVDELPPVTIGPPRGPAGNAGGPGRLRSPLLTFTHSMALPESSRIHSFAGDFSFSTIRAASTRPAPSRTSRR